MTTLTSVLRLFSKAVALLLLATACAPRVWTAEPEARGVPGFDTRDFPGDAVMRQWREHSPYRWVGYYLPAPCYTGTSWVGQRGALQEMGWGLAVLFVGEQDWVAINPARAAIDQAAPEGARCTTRNLSAERGAADALEADSVAAAEGFAPGTAVYLNVERVEEVSPELTAYVRGWFGGMLDTSRFMPALYAHAHNAATLYQVAEEEFARRGREGPRLWVARQSGTDMLGTPGGSGFPNAHVWQGIFDTPQTWGGETLIIDVNVANSTSPSAPR